MDPITILATVGGSWLLLASFAAFMFVRSIRSVREAGRYGKLNNY